MFSQLFTWWNSTTYGTSFTLWRKGAREVGRDEQGNRYFEEKANLCRGARTRAHAAGWSITVLRKPRGCRPIGMAGCITLLTSRRRKRR